MSERTSERPTVAVVHPYWSFWEHTAGPTFRSDRLDLARRLADDFDDLVEPVVVADVASVEEGAALGRRLQEAAPDVVLVLMSMAVPPAYVLAALDALPRVPLVVWAVHLTGLVGGDFDHGGITTQGATVGAPMLTNMLSRRDRPFELVLGRVSDEAVVAKVRASLRRAGVAGRIRRARLGRVGRPVEGYLHVDLDEEALRGATGITTVTVDPDEVVDAWRAVDRTRVEGLEAEVRRDWLFEDDPTEGESLARSLRAALALEDVVIRHDLDGGAFNCHVPQFRFGDEIGIAPCWGLGRLTSMGRPFSCTGDMVTAVAMLLAKRLGAAAVYHEIEAIDYESGEVVIANSGEHDLAWLAPGERPRLRRNGWYCGKDPHCGVCAVFEPAPGPATLVGFTPHPDARGGFRFVAARGELTGRRFPETGTLNGAFRFRDGGVEEAWVRWAAAGVNHHSSATPGDIAADVAAVARHLGVEAVVV
jgi:L-arabinose isomerase